MKEIKLTQGKVALVDDEDFASLSQYSWCFTHGYAAARVGGRLLYMHKLVSPRCSRVDHINRNGLDNRRSNLRECSQSLNMGNSRKLNMGTHSRFKGVTWGRGKRNWLAWICKDYHHFYLGRFGTEEEAAREYDRAAVRLFGDFAFTNQKAGLL